MKNNEPEDDYDDHLAESKMRKRLDDALQAGSESGTPVLFDNDSFKKKMMKKHS